MATEQIAVLRAPLAAGVPPSAVAVYARWWQLETYLREVVYTELRAELGTRWTERIDPGVLSRAERDQVNAYMASADADEILAYADVGVLFELIEENWRLFEPILLPRPRWVGLTDVLKAIRHRSAHCRRPHADDLARLEQALRDLEPGAREFYRSYNHVSHRIGDRGGALVEGWVDRHHPDAARLLDHCDINYGITFQLGLTIRPSASGRSSSNSIAGTPGFIWEATWILAGDTAVRPAALWKSLDTGVRELLLHLLMDDSSVTATFAAVDGEREIADAIGRIFDAIVVTSRRPQPSDPMVPADADEWNARNLQVSASLPSKAQFNSTLAMFDPTDPAAFTIFSAD
ncbi:MAG TPA: Swt1 family HEPN domain-containing protein [Solirubrobacterales bacterium]|nr:Swt1 family HEPN domain-containing protein [Solirubrobacterales bacterium]